MGYFTSGRAAVGKKLEKKELLEEFQKHRRHNNTEPTALVSVSSRIVSTLSRALVKNRGVDEDGNQVKQEPAEAIWIAFIAVPDPGSGIYHHARSLAEQLGDGVNPVRYQSEYVFEWRIPQEYIIHTVSLQTLIDRGFGIENFIDEHGKPFSSDRLKGYIALNYVFPPKYGNGLGLNLELMVKHFGARAPVFNIAWQFINDCEFQLRSLCNRYGNRLELHELLGCRKNGIFTAPIEWWFDDLHWNLEYHQYKEWVFALEDCMQQDYIFFYEVHVRWNVH